MEIKTGFLPLNLAARRLNVPTEWLRTEADGGRVPVLRIGNKRLFDVDALRLALVNRAVKSIATESEASR